jgi:predicted ATPase
VVIGTYRPAEVAERGHPLKHVIQELHGRGQCEELRLAPLTANDIEQYLSKRLAGTVSPALPDLVYRRTGGNALFMVNVIEHCVQQGFIAEKDGRWDLARSAAAVEATIPPRLQQMIQTQIEKLNVDEQQVLEGASVVGTEFSAAAVAAGIKQEVETVEETCETLAREGHFLQAIGLVEWPDGTVSGRYRFHHGLYQNVLYEQIGEARRTRLHALIGEREEAGYGESAREFAGELAIHFERGRDYRRAALYQQQAGENALCYSAPREALDHITKGLAFLKLLPDTAERTRQELALQTALGAALALTQGYGAPAVEQAYTRAMELCRGIAETAQLFPTLWGLWVFYNARGELQTARGLAQQLLQVAQGPQNPWFCGQAHYALGVTLFWCGELVPAREQWEQSLTLYEAQSQHSLASPFLYGEDAPIIARCDLSLALELLGYSDQARVQSRAALTAAQEEASPLNVILTSILLSFVTQFRQDVATTQAQAETVIALATEHGTPFWVAAGRILRGWALTKQGQGEEGIAQMLEGLHAWRAMGAALMRTYWLGLLADAYVHTGRIEEGLQVLEEAQTDMRTRGEYICAAPFQRWKGELTLAQSSVQRLESGKENQKSKIKNQESKMIDSQALTPDPQGEAEACFQQAIKIARQQGAKALELRAVLSLVRLWLSQGKQHAARNTLSEIYYWFTEGFDTKDLQEAKALLDSLESSV